MLETLLEAGWAYHDKDSERLAGELEAAAGRDVAPGLLTGFLHLATHTIGEHLGDWPRARRLAERVLDARSPTTETAMAWARLSVARLLAGEPVLAVAAELDCLRAADKGAMGALIETRFMLIAALVGSGRAGEAAKLYETAMALARGAGEEAPARAIAVASNNLAAELVEAQARSAAEDALMAAAADAAHEFWRRCGDWVNEEKALYLKALVANALGRPGAALAHADAALAIVAANGPRPGDAALLRLARAEALGRLDAGEVGGN
jgi:hypothetical protein